jgi:uncharacterized membrane protein
MAVTQNPGRLPGIDWMRGLACVLMFQTHCYDSWLRPSARQTGFFVGSQLLATLPAPFFLFLAGISFALVTDKLRARGLLPGQIARTTMRRGLEIFGLGLLFRVQQYAFNWRWAPWTDLFRVDILNVIGLSMLLMALAVLLASWLEKAIARGSEHPGHAQRIRGISMAAAFLIAGAISLATPPLWTTCRPRWLPWMLESYVNGVHTYAEPQSFLFPIFPWAGFAFLGLAAGFILCSDWARQNQTRFFLYGGAAGLVLIGLGLGLDRLPLHFYAVYSYWTTSPEFFLVRSGLLLVFLWASYAWCRWGLGCWGFSPLIQLGRTSLLVYWLHIELVYGRMIVLPSQANSVLVASWGLAFIAVLMLVLSRLRTELAPYWSRTIATARVPT